MNRHARWHLPSGFQGELSKQQHTLLHRLLDEVDLVLFKASGSIALGDRGRHSEMDGTELTGTQASSLQTFSEVLINRKESIDSKTRSILNYVIKHPTTGKISRHVQTEEASSPSSIQVASADDQTINPVVRSSDGCRRPFVCRSTASAAPT